MKIYDKIIQGSDEWKELRHGKVGGSTAKEIMAKYEKPITECAAFYTLLSEQMEDFDPFTNEFTSFSMQRGNELEPEARTEYERITGIEMAQFGWIEIDNFVGISPDGWNIKLKKAIEIKCPAANTYAKYLLNFDEFLSDYVWQLVHYFVVLGVDSVDCVAYRPENKVQPIIIKTITSETVIQVSAKVSKPISELAEMLKFRLTTTKCAIDSEMAKIISTNNF